MVVNYPQDNAVTFTAKKRKNGAVMQIGRNQIELHSFTATKASFWKVIFNTIWVAYHVTLIFWFSWVSLQEASMK